MFWRKRDCRLNVQYKLMYSLEKARNNWVNKQGWCIYMQDDLAAQIPLILAEVQYRYLLKQAKTEKFINIWYIELYQKKVEAAHY